MIDTIKFEVHGISKRMHARIQKSLDSHLIVNNESGEIYREITKGFLRGSYDYRICLQWKTERYSVIKTDVTYNVGNIIIPAEDKTAPVLIESRPYLLIEFSLPKFYEGVNFLNSDFSEDLCRLLLTRDKLCFYAWLQKITGAILPGPENWKIQRLDCAECFEFYNHQNIIDFISLLRNLTYPRRKKPTFWHDSLYISGSTTTVKLYNKHPEFKKHDYPRLSAVFRDKLQAQRVLDLTYGKLRFEVEFKRKKLIALGIYRVSDLCKIDWSQEMKKEFFKLIDGAKTTKTYRQIDVEKIIMDADLKKKGIHGTTCLAIWTAIVLHGKCHANKIYGRQKVWRACKVFKMLDLNTLGFLEDSKRPALSLVENNIFAYTQQNNYSQRRQYLSAIGE